MATKKSRSKTSKSYAFDRESMDRISRHLNTQKLVPAEFRDTDKFIDVVSWNLRWFDHRDPARIRAITEVMSELNSDIFVLTEVAQDGALDEVGKNLETKKAGYYSLAYGKTGGQQRVVLMWDRDWVRTKMDARELFESEDLEIKTEEGRRAKVFPRLPLWGYFEARPSDLASRNEGFNFELLGLHLKSQMAPRGSNVSRGGIAQRTKAAERLAEWLAKPSEHYDEDIVLVGDWNAKPTEKEWSALADLESKGEISFESINPAREVTHIARFNRAGAGGTRLDLHVINKPADAAAVPGKSGVVVRWSLFDDLNVITSAERRKLFKTFTHFISDHLPVLSRFYTVDKDGLRGRGGS